MHLNRCLLIVLLLASFANYSFASDQVDITLQKDSYSSKETMLVEIYLNDKPVKDFSASALSLSKGSIAPILVKETNNHYYAYFNLPTLDNGNYKLNIKLLYKINNVLKTLTFSKDFSIVNNNRQSFSLNPAIVKIDATKMQNYQVYITNNNDNEIGVELSKSADYVSLSKSAILFDGSVQRSFFIVVDKTKITSNKTTFIQMNSDDFSISIPILVYNFKESGIDVPSTQQKDSTTTNKSITPINESTDTKEIQEINKSDQKTENQTIIQIKTPIAFDSVNDAIELSISKNNSLAGPLKLRNYLNKRLVSIRFNLTGNLNEIARLNLTYVNHIDEYGSINQYIFINERKNAENKIYKGNIIVTSYEGYSTIMPVEISVSKETLYEKSKKVVKAVVNQNEEEPLKDYYQNQVLDFSTQKLYKEKVLVKPSRLPLLILLLLFVLGIFIFYKLMTRKKPKDFNDYIYSLRK